MASPELHRVPIRPEEWTHHEASFETAALCDAPQMRSLAIRCVSQHTRISFTPGDPAVHAPTDGICLTDDQRLDWLRLIRSENVGPRGIMAQTPQASRLVADYLPV
jgi:hypothetical protein